MRATTRAWAGVLLAAASATGLAACSGAQAGPAPDAAPLTPFSQELHDALPAQVADAGRLTVVTSAGYAPVMFYGPDGRELQGSEADLAAALGRVLGVEVEFVDAAFPDILGMVEAGEADLGMSGITDTALRQEQVDFVDYFQAGTSILVQKGNAAGVSDLDSLCGERISVGEGTTQADMAVRLVGSCGAEPPEVVTSVNAADAILELRAGAVAATLVDYPPAAHMASDPKSSANYELADDEQYEPAPFGIAVSRERVGLAEVVQDAMVAVHDSGEYDQVLERWNLQAGRLDEIALNAGS